MMDATNSGPAATDMVKAHRAIQQLASMDVGEVRLGKHDLQLYATDASNYQVQPLAVVICQNAEQVARLAAYCYTHRLPLLPRGGGTSLAGQCTNRAVVMDLSVHFRRVLNVDDEKRLCRVQAGTTIDQVNNHLLSQHFDLFFAPDPATLSHACIGGCIGNNAAGARSIRYGRTSENLAAIDAILADGTIVQFGPGAGRVDAKAADLALAVAALVNKHRAAIRAGYPRLNRRNAGYALDMILDQLDAGCDPLDLNLVPLICGSEGTLAIVTEATLKLSPTPQSRMLFLLRFASLDMAIAAVVPILRLRPTAVELMDDVVLAAAKTNADAAAIMRKLDLGGTSTGQDQTGPSAVLLVEFQSERDGSGGVPSNIDQLLCDAAGTGHVQRLNTDEQAAAWQIRRSAEALLHALSSDAKPVTFIEDNAIPVEHLSRFIHGVRDIVLQYRTTAAYYAHASVGVLHIRPLLNLHAPADRKAMVNIAIDVARLARQCGGVMSGEHGDGRVRGPLLKEFFGPEIMHMFTEVKRIFDPVGILNPGMIADAGEPESIAQQLRIDSLHAAAEATLHPVFDYSHQGSWVGAVEMCNGAGFCRKLGPGTMCPSYRATLDERHSPRGRANALRHALLAPAAKPNLNDAEALKTLDLCLSCKACKTECPSNVDIAKLKSEYYSASFRANGRIPLSARCVGNIRQLNLIGACLPQLANHVVQARWFRQRILPRLGITPHHPLPLFAPSLRRRLKREPQKLRRPGSPRVALFADCFAGFTDSAVGLAAVKLLSYLDYDVAVADGGCCGRSMISVGMLDQARITALRTLQRIENINARFSPEAILFLEPSCQSAFIDDWRDLLPSEERKAYAQLPPLLSVEEFIVSKWASLKIGIQSERTSGQVIYHGHCHQKALWGQDAMQQLLNHFAGRNGRIMPTGCCGLAGSFGYGLQRYDISKTIFAACEFDPIRAADETDVVLASGTSCRAQIRHFTRHRPLHPVEWLLQCVNDDASPSHAD
jgi:FAD/FMN-containing dehydrogenase/Fe-S oxidoreductase